MHETRNRPLADAEVINLLMAISRVTARLAGKLTILAAQIRSGKGGNTEC